MDIALLMSKLRFGALEQLPMLVRSEAPILLVSIRDLGAEPALSSVPQGSVTHKVYADDIEHPEIESAFTQPMARALLEQFSRAIEADRLIVVHCHSGRSRSSAAACQAMAMLGGDVDAIEGVIRRYSPCARPNQLLIDYLADEGEHGDVVRAVSARFR